MTKEFEVFINLNQTRGSSKVSAKGNTLKEALQNLIKEVKKLKKPYLVYIDTCINIHYHSLRLMCQNKFDSITNIYSIFIRCYKDKKKYIYDNFISLNLSGITKEDHDFINNNLHLYMYDYRANEWIERTGRKYYSVMVELLKYVENKYDIKEECISGFYTNKYYKCITLNHEDGNKEYFPVVATKRITKKLKLFMDIFNSQKNTNP